jgi:DNA-binding LacI/PurR family transcriptional regulator
VVTRHLIRCGCRSVVFLGRPGSAPTVDARIAGYQEAVADGKLRSGPQVCRIDPEDQVQVKKILRQLRPKGIVCANDFTAARLLRTLTDLGVSVPDDIAMAGIDDVKYASLLSVPLTTIHQPCAIMGAIAVSAMIERVRNPKLPTRDILLTFILFSASPAVRGKRN